MDGPLPVNGQATPPPAGVINTPVSDSVLPSATGPVLLDTTAITPGSQIVQGRRHSPRQVWLVTGPAGSGKSTVAQFLSSSLKFPYVEGDEFHPPSNIEKMSAGIPLTDADRWDWLTALREEAIRQLATPSDGVVLTCSALKRKYRDVLRVATYFHSDVIIRFIYLSATEAMLLERVAARQNHYMGANMVQSQFSILERPQDDEFDVISVDVSRPMEAVKSDALAQVLNAIALEKKT